MSTPHPPTHANVTERDRDPSIPMTMRVAVEIGYVRGCADCETLVSQIARQCIVDRTCTSFKAIPGRTHAHEVTEGSQALPGLTSAPARAPGAALPISDTNGYHPDLVAGIVDSDLVAGIVDPKGRAE